MLTKSGTFPTVSALLFLVFSAGCAREAAFQTTEQWTVTSPNGRVSVAIVQKVLGEPYPPENNLYYCIALDGREVLPYAPLGVTMDGTGGNYLSRLTFTRQRQSVINETYPMVSGKKNTHRNHANEKTLIFTNPQGSILELIFRAYDDGIAYRYHFPGRGQRKITGESSAFRLPAGSVGWLQNYVPYYEGFYTRSDGRARQKREIGFPALFHTPAGTWVLVTESAVYGDYGGARLFGSLGGENLFEVKIPHKLSGRLPWTTPWRAAIIGKNLGTIVESVMVDNLNPTCEVKDLSWIKPGRSAFPWWSDHEVTTSFDKIKAFADLAGDMGWEWLEFEVGLIGDPWNHKGTDDWMTTPWVPQLIKHAASRGVDCYGWDHWQKLDTPAKREKIFSLYNKFGLKGIKIDFMDNDSQKMFRWRDQTIKDCLKHKLMVSFHGATLPRGQRRRWPHIMTWEAVRGAEWYTDLRLPEPYPPNNSAHNCTLPFARNVVGPMDYTPVTFSAKTKTTTDAHELALSVIFESGWLNLADAPVVYASSPAKPFLKKVHAAWDDIHFIDGLPDQFVCLARRKENDWFIAGINAETARKLAVPLDFLERGTYPTRLYRDDSNAKSIAVENITLDTAKPFEIFMPANGGFCMRIAKSYDSKAALYTVR